MAATIETPVLIIGGGPVGLATAIELAWRGVDCTVIEQGDGSVDHPRLGVILTRTMEFCRRWEIVDRVYNCGFNNDYKLNVVYCTDLNGYLLGRDENPSPNELVRPVESPEKRQRCSQIWFNPILEKRAREYDNVTLRHFCKLRSFRSGPDEVQADAVDTKTGESVTFRAHYLIACDGAASTVRQALNVAMLGNPVLSYSINLFVRSSALPSMHDKGEAERYIFVGPHGTWANMTVVDGRELWRVTILGSEKVMDVATFDPQAAIARCMGRSDVPYELISVKPWRRTELTAQKFEHGRVFLAGDSAHTMSPTGGFGMSTGVADSVDLGWKLDAVLNGWGGAHLLESYDEERRPIAIRAAAASARNFRAWVSASETASILDDTPEGAETRERIGQHMLAAGREDWDCLGMQLGYRYEGSPICIADGTPAPPDTVIEYNPTSRPGARAPHAWLKDGRSTLDLYGRGFVLVRSGQDAPPVEPLVRAACGQSMPLKVIDIEDPEIARLYERKLVLVRPDGHVAWRGDALPSDPALVASAVRGALAPRDKSALDAA